MPDDEGEDMRSQVLFALVQRAGGRVVIPQSELPVAEYTFFRRWTDDGGIEIVASLNGAAQ